MYHHWEAEGDGVPHGEGQALSCRLAHQWDSGDIACQFQTGIADEARPQSYTGAL